MAQNMRPSLKCCCCTWYSRLGDLEAYHSVLLLGTGADFYQQLKLDFLDTLVKAFNYKKYFLQLFIRAYTLI